MTLATLWQGAIIFFSIDDGCLERLDRMRPGSVDADFQPCRGRLGFGRREEKERKKWRLSVFSSYLVKPEYSLISTTCLSKQIKSGHFSLSLSPSFSSMLCLLIQIMTKSFCSFSFLPLSVLFFGLNGCDACFRVFLGDCEQLFYLLTLNLLPIAC